MSQAFWTETARRDLALLDDQGKLSSDQADRIGRAALAAGRFLAEQPMTGPSLSSGLRKWHVRGTRFFVVYRPASEGVEILRLLDARSDWRTVFD